MKKLKTLSVGFNAKIKPFQKLNDQFVVCKCYIHGLGKNRNLSHFSKENVLRNLHTIFNIPVVGHLIEAEDGSRYVGSHDVEISLTEQGLKFKDLTVPFGVVPEQGEDTMYFEDVVEPDGTTVTYLVGKIILWCGRYPELLDAIYSEDIYFNESMEINFENAKPLEDDRNYLDLIDYTYSALCLLGKSDNPDKHSEPCFPCSVVEPYKFSFNKTEFSEMMSELKTELAFCFENIKTVKEGGEKILDKERINQILIEFQINPEDVNFEIDKDMTEEDLRSKLNEFANMQSQPSKAEVYAATYLQKRKALENACEPLRIRNDEGDTISSTYYWVMDFDDQYVFVERNVWDDNNNETTYGRFSYIFNEGDLTVTLTSEFEVMVSVWLTVEENEKLIQSRSVFEALQAEFDNYKKDYSIPNSEVETLKAFKESRLAEDRKVEVESVLAEFEDLAENDEFKTLALNAAEYENIEDLRKDCYAIRGKASQVKFSTKQNKDTKIKLPIANHQSNDDEPYGGLFNIYGNK